MEFLDYENSFGPPWMSKEIDNMDNGTIESRMFTDDVQHINEDISGSSEIMEKISNSNEDQSIDFLDQFDELKALGITVMDQLDMERNVEAAVDEAVAVHSRKQKMKILQKEIKDLKIDIKQAEYKHHELKNRLAGMRQRLVDPRQVMSLEAEMKNKVNQLKTQRAREKFLLAKLSLAEENSVALDTYELEEGEILENENVIDSESLCTSTKSNKEKEEMIRDGKMTPFGTIITPGTSKTVVFPRQKNDLLPNDRKMTIKSSLDKKITKEDLIKTGQMTPFGTIIKNTEKNSITKKSEKNDGEKNTFEKYLQDQIDLQKKHSNTNKGPKRNKGDPNYGFEKKKSKKLKEYIGEWNKDEENGISLTSIKKKAKSNVIKTKKKDPIKKSILNPKKKPRKGLPLGSQTSDLEIYQNRRSAKPLSECVALDPGSDDSGQEYPNESESDYVPSEQDESDADYCPDNADESKSGKHAPKRQKRKICVFKKNKKVKYITDDSDSDIEVSRKPKGRKSSKAVDDGHMSDYAKRIESWREQRLREKQNKIFRGEDLDSDEEEEGYEEFEGGFKIPLIIWKKLYKYQRTCIRWLWELHGQGCGGILGDEMGLGKTIQIISFLVGISYSRLQSRTTRFRGLGPTLVVCPATVLHQWVKEFQKWWPPFRVAVLHESGSFTGTRASLIHNIHSHKGILLISYGGVQHQIEILSQYTWHYVILDEGHKIRNPEAQITTAVKRLETPHRLILSGTPIQNNLKELWSLFDFVFPGKLGTLPVFLQQFSVPITLGGYANASKLEVQTAFRCASVLRDTINPYLLRRMKNDVRADLTLPDKNEQVLFCALTEEQRRLYREYIESPQVKSIMGGRCKVFVGLILLRKICNHADLYSPPKNVDVTNETTSLQPELQYGHWSRSGKMQVLRSILRLWKTQGHRVLLFTQSRQMMCILEKFLISEEFIYQKMDGGTGVSARQPLIEKFNKDSDIFVFLLTTRVGGLGVNLIGADRVVIFDPDWNPSTDMQARERSWRIGQTRHVTIYRLLTAGTIEEKIYHRQIFKQFLCNRVLKDPKQQRFFKTNNLFELFTLNEGDKEKTETAAIFAGTGSEIKVNVTPSENNENEIDIEEQQSEKEAEKNRKIKRKESKRMKEEIERNKIKSKQLLEEAEKVKEDMLKMTDNIGSETLDVDSKKNRMRELAKQLSMKIGTKKDEETGSQKLNGDNIDCKDFNTKERNQHKKLGNNKYIENKKEKKEKRERKHKKGKKFEGERIEFLVKKRDYKKTAEEEEAAKRSSQSQDQFVLETLFKNSVVHTALSHDTIINQNDPDYLLLEGEAERVAKEALKAVRASRRRADRYTRPRSEGREREKSQPQPKVENKPKFGSKKSGIFNNDDLFKPEDVVKKFVKKPVNKPVKMFNGGIESEDESDNGDSFETKKSKFSPKKKSKFGSSNAISSSDLLSRMHQRNRGVIIASDEEDNNDDNEPEYPSLVPVENEESLDPEVQENIDLLTDIRNFIAFQAEVDGKASTKEIINKFKERLPKEQTHNFKALLKQICSFHRELNGEGIWQLIEEFR